MKFRVVISILLACAATPALADTFPDRPITMVVPFAAGGPADVIARALVNVISKKHRIIVENVGGAGGNIGALRVAKARPDGYTILLHGIGMAVSRILNPKLEYNPATDFAPIGQLSYNPLVVFARKDLPIEDVASFRKLANAPASHLTIGNSGSGGASHLCSVLFMSATQSNLIFVPYRGTAPAMADVLANQLDLSCDSIGAAAPHIGNGSIHAIGITSKERSKLLPQVPTLAEQGLTDFEMLNWTAVYAPVGTPPEIVSRLNEIVQDGLDDPLYKTAVERFGSVPTPKALSTPDRLKAYQRSEIARWTKLLAHARTGNQ
jgi:tripartite-type tricarboxylate transporter receptor subunit TctC